MIRKKPDGGRRCLLRLSALVFVAVTMTGCCPPWIDDADCNDSARFVPGKKCADIDVSGGRGRCVAADVSGCCAQPGCITRPEGASHPAVWARLDPSGLHLCQAPDTAILDRLPHHYSSISSAADDGVCRPDRKTCERIVHPGTIHYTTDPDLDFTVSAEATPDIIDAGGCTQLDASGRGGTAPYRYAWSGPNLSEPDIADPSACPDVTTDYTVAVTNADGFTLEETVTVIVNPAPLTVTIDPPAPFILYLDQVKLTAKVDGDPDGQHSTFWWPWAPDVPSFDEYVHAPTQTTTYRVTVRDRLPDNRIVSATAQATVTVQIPPMIACFTPAHGSTITVPADGMVRLDAGCTACPRCQGVLDFTYQWYREWPRPTVTASQLPVFTFDASAFKGTTRTIRLELKDDFGRYRNTDVFREYTFE